jgi:hypothetical protein
VKIGARSLKHHQHTGNPTEPEHRPPPASRLPSWVIREPLEHMSGGVCWCQPTYEEDPATGGRVFIHRATIDSPAREP